ncbi:S8 family serine peptidase [Arthrobacter sp. MPF02]|uniref:S8 family serine peptidase n=1 Tax=Arthrobacter sp. MPF02 TaxID=3388492 RepID=UPI003984E294
MSFPQRFGSSFGVLMAAMMLAVPPAAAFTPAVPAPPGQSPSDSERYLVSFSKGANADKEAENLRSAGVQVRKTFSAAVQGAAVTATKAEAASLARSPRIAAIERDDAIKVFDTQQSAPWGLDRIDQNALPLSGTFTPPSSGAGVNAYVVDSGVLAGHTEFGGRVAAGWTAVNDGRGSSDCNGHGTHVAGVVAGQTYGVAKAATVIPVRVLDCNGLGYMSDIIAGLDWIASHHAAGTPAVANLSLGGTASTMVDAAVRGIIADGVTTTVAAGNDAVDACNTSPARVPEALTIAASDSSDRQAKFSNYGSCVDLYAPGVGITSALHSSPTAAGTGSGTSMAAPHAAGAAAVLLARNPAATPAEITAELASTATPDTITNPSPGTPNRLLNIGPVPAPFPAARDFTGDAKSDLLARDSGGNLWTYPGTGNGTFGARISVGGGWQDMTAISAAGDLTSDGKPDLTARDSGGNLWTYPGTGNGTFGARISVGGGWQDMTAISAAGDLTSDGKPDLTARDSGGNLWTYPGTGNGTFGARINVGGGWQDMTAISAAGDLTSDGKPDLTARDSGGNLWTYPGTGNGTFGARINVGGGWQDMTAISAAGDLTSDGKPDLTARDSGGNLWTYPGTGNGTFGARIHVGGGWQDMTAIS